LFASANAELAHTDHAHMGVLTITTIVLVAAAVFVAVRHLPERWRAEERRRLADMELRQTAALNEAILASLPLPIVVLDRTGTVLSCQEPIGDAPRESLLGSTPPLEPGANFACWYRQLGERGAADAARVAAGVEAVCAGAVSFWGGEYSHRSSDGGRECCVGIRVNALRRPQGGAVVSYHDITGRRQAERALRELSGRLIAAQEQERHRIARELHDDLSQRLALLAIELEQLAMPPTPSQAELSLRSRGLWQKTSEIAADLHRVSHQLHPTKLEALGLVPAINGFCQDLRRQHHLQVRFAHQNVPRTIPRGVALCLYRIVQEALHNVIKHSGVLEAEVQLTGTASHELQLRVADSGGGFAVNNCSWAGLGLISMRERVHSIDGTLFLHSEPGHGTRIGVTVRLQPGAAVMQSA
jgi:signal transduction histidine kinase